MKFYCNVASRTLDNGVRIFVFPQPGSAVEVQCFIRTGSIHEGNRLGYGLSHFLEHMLFQGCRDYPGTLAADSLDRLGGSMNAYTSYDHTAYHANLAGRHLPEAVRILSRMVRFPEFPGARFAEEREVILREEEMGRDNPDRLLYTRLNASIYQEHPLRHPVIGYRELIAEVTRDIMAQYHAERYTPDRCFWVVVGDVEPEMAFELIDAEMNGWGRCCLAEQAIAPEPTQCAPRSDGFVFTDPLERLAAGVRIPEITHPDIAAYDVLAGILGMGGSSRLVRRLELEEQLAVKLRSYSYSQAAGGLLAITAHTIPAKTKRLERALLHELELIRKGDLTKAEVEREKTQQYSEHLRELRGIREIAANIGGSVIATGSPEFGDLYLERLRKLTLDDVNRVAQIFDAERLNLVRQSSGATRKKSTATVRRPQLTAEGATLANGARQVTIADRRLPMVDFALALPGGTLFEKPEEAGISGMLTDLLTAGAGRYSENALLAGLDAGGADFSVQAGLNSFLIECTCPRRHFAKVFRFLKEILSAPSFGLAEFEREKENRRESLKSRAMLPRIAAEDRARTLLYGNHPYGRGTAGMLERLEAMTRDHVAEFYHSRLVPEQAIFGWGGDCTAEEAKRWSDELAAAMPWRGSGSRIGFPAPPEFPTASQNAFISLPREQTMVLSAVPGVAFDSGLFQMFEILFQAENGLSSPVFKLIREENSLAYSTGMRIFSGFHPGWFGFYAITAAESAERALKLLESERMRLAETGLTREEFEAAREGAAFSAARAAESVGSALNETLLSMHYGQGLNGCFQHEAELRAISHDALNQALRPYLSSSAAVHVLAGRLPNPKEMLS